MERGLLGWKGGGGLYKLLGRPLLDPNTQL
jgi:hypothetical protein